MVAAVGAERPVEYVQALGRGLEVLRVFNAGSPQLTMTEVAELTGITKAAARRFLLTLVELGYAHFDGRKFSLRPRVLEIGHAYLSSIRLPQLAMTHLEWLASSVRETSSLTVLDGSDVVYVARAQGFRIMTVSIEVGTRLPALLTSTGRVMMADWPEERLLEFIDEAAVSRRTRHTIVSEDRLLKEVNLARDRGWALTDQELDEGLRSVAVPIRSANGTVIAAVNVSAHANRASADDLRRETLPRLLEAAQRIQSDIAGLE